MAKTLQINELTNRIAAPPQLYQLAAMQPVELQCVAVIQIVELKLGFPIVQFSSNNIEVSKSYSQNATDQ
jgi:hypothetical protein